MVQKFHSAGKDGAGSSRKAGRPRKGFERETTSVDRLYSGSTVPRGIFEQAIVKLNAAGITKDDRIAIAWNPINPSTNKSMAMGFELAGKTSFGNESTAGIRLNNLVVIEEQLKELTATVLINAGPQSAEDKPFNEQLEQISGKLGIRYLIAEELLK